MSKRSTRLIERIAVAYVDRLVTAVNLIWRQLTSQDIGLDGLVDSEGGGGAFVQIKGSEESFSTNRSLTFKFSSKSNDKYWLSRGLPLIVCLVRCAKTHNAGLECYWIDYARARGSKRPAKSSCTFQLDSLNAITPQVYVKTGADLSSSRSKLSKWLKENVLSFSDVRLESAINEAEILVEQGMPDRALNVLHARREKRNTPVRLVLGLAKVYRRLGEGRRLSALIRGVRERADPRSWRILNYEQGFHEMISAFRGVGKNLEVRWKKAEDCFKVSYKGCTDPKEKLIAYTCLVHLDALRRFRNKSYKIRVAFRTTLNALLHQWIEEGSKGNQAEFTRRILNARLSLCRSYIALEERELAIGELGRVEKMYRGNNTYHSALWLAHLRLVRALYSKYCALEVLSESTQGLLVTLGGLNRDPEIQAYHDLLVESRKTP